jgi:Glycosyltransferase 61
MLPAGLSAAKLLKLPGEASPSWAIFDPSWYVRAYSAVCGTLGDTSPTALLSFYLQVGQGQGHSPNRYFDETWYRMAHRGVVQGVQDAQYLSGFDHYCRVGYRTLAPHWLFSEQDYRDRNPDLADEILDAANVANGYDHFLRWGAQECRRAHPFFDPDIYQAGLDPDAARVSVQGGPFHHFLDRIESGRYELRTSQYIDPAWYLLRHPEVASAIESGAWRCALHHYLANDTPTRFDPSPEFSEAHYLRRYPDVAAFVQRGGYRNGYAHFIDIGLAEGRLAEAASEPAPGESETSTGKQAPALPMEQSPVASKGSQAGAEAPAKHPANTDPLAERNTNELIERLEVESSSDNTAPVPDEYQGSLDLCTSTRLSGWAVKNGVPAELDVLVNDRTIARIRCRWRRPDLVPHGLPINAGFEFVFDAPIAPFDKVSVRFAGGPELTNSPNTPLRNETSGTKRTDEGCVVLVLGMEQSGAAFCANLLGLLGVHFGAGDPSTSDDGRSRWASADLLAFHDRLLSALKIAECDLDEIPDLPTEVWAEDSVRLIRGEMVEWLRAQLIRNRHFGFHDPRAVWLLPIWDEICAELGVEAQYMLCVREPAQVAQSVEALGLLDLRRGEYRWMVHTAQLVHNLGDRQVCIVPHRGWQQNGDNANMLRITSALGLERMAENSLVAQLTKQTFDLGLWENIDQPAATAGSIAQDLYDRIVGCAPAGCLDQSVRSVAGDIIAFVAFVQPMLPTFGRGRVRSASGATATSGPARISTSQSQLAEGLVSTIRHYSDALQIVLSQIGERAQATAAPASTQTEAVEHAQCDIPVETIDAGRAGDLDAQLILKERLVEQFGLLKGFQLYSSLVVLPVVSEIVQMPLLNLWTIAAKEASVFQDVSMPSKPAIRLACLNGAKVRGRSALIEFSGTMLYDFEPDVAPLYDWVTADPGVFHATSESVHAILPKSEADVLELDEAFHLVGPRSGDLRRWTWEYLPKLVAGSMSDALARVPVLVDAGLGMTQRQMLQLLLADDQEIVPLHDFATACVARLWCASTPIYMPPLEHGNAHVEWDHPTSPPAPLLATLQEMVRRIEPRIPKTNCERLYLAAPAAGAGRMANGHIIEAVAQARGFTIVRPEELDFVALAALLRHARHIVGPESPALWLSFFAKPGAKVCVLNRPDNAGLALLLGSLAALDIDATVLAGTSCNVHARDPQLSEYEMDEIAFAQFVHSWLRDGTR